MSQKIEARVPRGMRDIIPEQMVRRRFVIDVIQQVFEQFGFEPLQTPAIELEETLKGKYGPDAERLIYSATYGQGEERLSLRYDLTVPLCRVVAMYPELPKPFKRYQIAPLWRADRPQKGRFREFYQCDVDTVGSSSMLADAETVAVIYTALVRLGFKSFTIHINNRKLLNGIGRYAGVPAGLLKGLYQSIDKLPKIGVEGVRQELLAVGLPDPLFDAMRKMARLVLQGKLKLEDFENRLSQEPLPAAKGETAALFPVETARAVSPDLIAALGRVKPGEVQPERVQEASGQLVSAATPALRRALAATTDLIPEQVVDQLLALLAVGGDNAAILQSLLERLAGYPEAVQGIRELEEMIHSLELLGVPERYYAVDVSMARGLDYYTGPIYETIVEEANIGSITGGGRFDNLIGMFSERSLPATGTSFGIERVIVAMDELGLFPPAIGKSSVQVLVTIFDRSLVDEAVKAASRLRQEGLRVQLFSDPAPLRDQIGYAVTKDIPFLVILGPDEVSQGNLTARNLRTKEQQTVAAAQAASLMKRWLE